MWWLNSCCAPCEHELAIQESYIDTGVFGLETEVHGLYVLNRQLPCAVNKIKDNYYYMKTHVTCDW